MQFSADRRGRGKRPRWAAAPPLSSQRERHLLATLSREVVQGCLAEQTGGGCPNAWFEKSRRECYQGGVESLRYPLI